MDDKEAIDKTLGGSVEAFGILVARYQSAAYAIALARVYDYQDAQDLSQEAFLRAYVRLPMLRNRDAFAPWLFTIVRRLCVDLMRGRWRTERMQQAVRRTESTATSSTNPQQEICATDTARTLWSQVGQLDDRSREVLSLYYGQKMTVSEVAAITATRESAVKMRLQKARTRLGNRIGDLKGVWGIAPLPAFSSGIMKSVTAAGPLKGAAAAGSFLGGILALPALLSMFGLSAARDVDRWHNHTSAGMLTQGKRAILRAILFIWAVFIGVFALAALVSAVLSIALLPKHMPAFSLPRGVAFGVLAVYFAAIGALLIAIFKREIDLLSPWEKAKQFAGAASALALVAVVSNFPAYAMPTLGGFLMLQYFFINKSNIALGSVPPGIWVAPVLAHECGVTEAVAVSKEQIRTWLTMLHEYGLVAPPLKSDDRRYTVRLRLRGSIFEKMARGRDASSLCVDSHGVVRCTIVPRDYVTLAQHLGLDELPGRQQLADRLGVTFTGALATHAKGGDNRAVAGSLGLDLCPIDPAKTNGFLLQRYLLPLIGAVLVVVFVLRQML